MLAIALGCIAIHPELVCIFMFNYVACFRPRNPLCREQVLTGRTDTQTESRRSPVHPAHAWRDSVTSSTFRADSVAPKQQPGSKVQKALQHMCYETRCHDGAAARLLETCNSGRVSCRISKRSVRAVRLAKVGIKWSCTDSLSAMVRVRCQENTLSHPGMHRKGSISPGKIISNKHNVQ